MISQTQWWNYSTMNFRKYFSENYITVSFVKCGLRLVSLSTLNAEMWRLNRSSYFLLIHKFKPSKHRQVLLFSPLRASSGKSGEILGVQQGIFSWKSGKHGNSGQFRIFSRVISIFYLFIYLFFKFIFCICILFLDTVKCEGSRWGEKTEERTRSWTRDSRFAAHSSSADRSAGIVAVFLAVGCRFTVLPFRS